MKYKKGDWVELHGTGELIQLISTSDGCYAGVDPCNTSMAISGPFTDIKRKLPFYEPAAARLFGLNAEPRWRRAGMLLKDAAKPTAWTAQRGKRSWLYSADQCERSEVTNDGT